MDLRELFGCMEEWLNVTPRAIAWRRGVVSRMNHREKREFIEATKVFYHGMEKLGNGFALPIQVELEQASKVTSRRRPGQLLDLAEFTTGQDDVSRRQKFEALRKFDISLMLSEIERRDPELGVLDDIDALLDLFEEELFVGSKRVVIWSYHASTDKMHVRQIRVGRENRLDSLTLSDPNSPLIERMHDLTVRVLRNGSYTLLLDRAKGTFRTFLKMLRQFLDSEKNEFFDQVLDRRGIKQVYLDADHLYHAVNLQKSMIEFGGGSFVKKHDNILRPGTKDNSNGESDRLYKALDAQVEVGGSVFEMIFQIFSDFWSGQFAIDNVNHELYAQRQALNHIFDLFWPFSIYEINWADRALKQALRHWKSGNVRFGSGWRDPRVPHDSGTYPRIIKP